MGKLIDLTGQKFGRLTVIERSDNYVAAGGAIITRWKCKCSCGNEVVVLRSNLKNGNTLSCGCICKERPNGLKHGQSRTRLYNAWCHMKSRCYKKNHKQYKDYGGRGIKICREWIGEQGLNKFIDWAISHGYNDTLTLDRIDVNGNYEPSNCRWITLKEQQINKRNNHLITYNGKTKPMAEWARDCNIKYSTLKNRINRYRWNIEKALTTP